MSNNTIYNFTITTSDNIKLNVLTHKIDKMKCILIHLHGLGNHFQNIYESTDSFHNRINMLEKNKIISYALELRGHGLSDGIKFHINNFDEYLIDLDTLVKYLQINNPSIPIHIIGESMGGALAIKYCIKYSNNIASIILMAPMCGVSIISSLSYIKIYTMLALSYIFPSYKLIPKNNKNCLYNMMYLEAKNKCIYTNNENIRLSTGRECYYVMNYITQNKHLFTTPVYAVHSKQDDTTEYSITENFINTCGSTNKSLLLLDDSNHYLLIEKDDHDMMPKTVLESICKWLVEDLSKINI